MTKNPTLVKPVRRACARLDIDIKTERLALHLTRCLVRTLLLPLVAARTLVCGQGKRAAAKQLNKAPLVARRARALVRVWGWGNLKSASKNTSDPFLKTRKKHFDFYFSHWRDACDLVLAF